MDVWLLAAFRSLEHWAEAPGHSRAWTCLDFFLRFCAIFFSSSQKKSRYLSSRGHSEPAGRWAELMSSSHGVQCASINGLARPTSDGL